MAATGKKYSKTVKNPKTGPEEDRSLRREGLHHRPRDKAWRQLLR